MTATQNKIIHSLLHSTGLLTQKAALVASFSKGRTESSRELDVTEAQIFINYLQAEGKKQKANNPTPAEKMRRKIISLAHQMGWRVTGTQKIDMLRINAWATKYGYLHKPLNSYKEAELPRLLTQFETMYKDFLNRI